jgi:integrase/recombinase XerD
MLRSEAFRLVRNRSRAMNDSTRETSPLRQRMLEDMRLRKLATQTQVAYIRSVRRLAGYLRRPPDTATVEDLRNFQLHLVDRGTSPITLNATITGLKFFFGVTLDRAELMAKMKPVFVPRTLPVVLSREEVTSLIAATRNLKHQTALSVAYGAGLRAGEVAALKVGDVDSTRMTLRIQQGKGSKDRYAMLSPVMLERLRTWWRVARAQGKMVEGGWLFPSTEALQLFCIASSSRATRWANSSLIAPPWRYRATGLSVSIPSGSATMGRSAATTEDSARTSGIAHRWLVVRVRGNTVGFIPGGPEALSRPSSYFP